MLQKQNRPLVRPVLIFYKRNVTIRDNCSRFFNRETPPPKSVNVTCHNHFVSLAKILIFFFQTNICTKNIGTAPNYSK